MIPLKGSVRIKRYPWVTVAILTLNVAVYVYGLFLDPQAQSILFLRAGAIPLELTQNRDFGPFANLVPVPFTIFTSLFLHAGFMHVAGNMLYLWIFAQAIEDAMGRVRFFFFYLVSGVLATSLHVLMNPSSQVPIVGASGAIAGILGAYMMLYPSARVRTLIFFFIFIRVIELPAAVMLGYWFLLQLLGLSSGGGVAWYAHIGGFVAGLILVRVFLPVQRPSRGWFG
ncbi:MAG: rhomboid family intramembrane serine protease [Candidatus Tectomicrobia bacterium]|nr:rhomboid family intramembrane serine protease [Candidatus Tectomicrobia bacterium]